jgi:AraC family transcriptional regulator
VIDGGQISVDWSQETEILQVLPKPPVLSSVSLGWSAIEVQCHRQPAWECPEHAFKQHVISVHHFPEPARSLRLFAGQRKQESLGEGDVVIMPAGVPHWNRWDKPGEFTLFIIEPEKLTEMAQGTLDPRKIEIVPRFSRPDPLIGCMGDALEKELRLGTPAGDLYVDSLAAALLHHLLRHHASSPLPPEERPKAKRSEIRRAIELIHDRLGENLQLSEIARSANLSAYHFARVFKQVVGMPPHQYVIGCRIGRAKELLRSGSLTIQEIAYIVGFANQSHFTAHFRKLVGITPKGYRRSV